MARASRASALALLLMFGIWTATFNFACAHKSSLGAKAEAEAVADSEREAAANRLPRPRRASGSTLRNWLAAKESPASAERISDCQAQIVSIATSARDQAELRLVSRKLRADVATELKLYHFCYYHLLMRLEQLLEQDQLGRSLSDKTRSFIEEFRGLWILAIALDQHTEQVYYRSVARRRYIDLSQLYFGRSLRHAPGTIEPDEEELDPAEEGDESDLIVPGDDPLPGSPDDQGPSSSPAPPSTPGVGK